MFKVKKTVLYVSGIIAIILLSSSLHKEKAINSSTHLLDVHKLAIAVDSKANATHLNQNGEATVKDWEKLLHKISSDI